MLPEKEGKGGAGKGEEQWASEEMVGQGRGYWRGSSDRLGDEESCKIDALIKEKLEEYDNQACFSMAVRVLNVDGVSF